MENNFEHIEGENTECDWLKFTKFSQFTTIPEQERNELLNNFDNQRNFSRIKKISKENLILFFIGTKIFFLNKQNLSRFFKKVFINLSFIYNFSRK